MNFKNKKTLFRELPSIYLVAIRCHNAMILQLANLTENDISIKIMISALVAFAAIIEAFSFTPILPE